jgi:hypothetical protein
VPIFVMRPFRGQLEGATHAVVERLRMDGDNAVFWLDTSGWLDTEIDFQGNAANQDFFLNDNTHPLPIILFILTDVNKIVLRRNGA